MDGHFSEETCQAFFLQEKKREEKVKVKKESDMLRSSRARPAHDSIEVVQIAYLPNTEQSCLVNEAYPS